MISLGIGLTRLCRSPHWVAALVAEWRRRIRCRRELERFSERDLADIGLKRDDALCEIQKPFWKA
jgi:uncharacterized protein YjiS (DUF1127 family)